MRTAAVAAVLAALSEGVLEGAWYCVARVGAYKLQRSACLTGVAPAGFPEGPRKLYHGKGPKDHIPRLPFTRRWIDFRVAHTQTPQPLPLNRHPNTM